jgi:hypothetical protein
MRTHFEQIAVEEVRALIALMDDGPTLEQVEVVPCPTCGAKPGEKCKLINGESRMDPHHNRRRTAEDLLSS